LGKIAKDLLPLAESWHEEKTAQLMMGSRGEERK